MDMEIVGTREAFLTLVKQPGFAGRSGIDKTLVSLWASGKRVPTLDKMEEVLLSQGASVVQEKVWEVAIDPYVKKMIDFENELRTKKIGDSITAIYKNGLGRWPVRNLINYYAGELGCIADTSNPDEYTEIFTFLEKTS